jgi:hypothetical protein
MCFGTLKLSNVPVLGVLFKKFQTKTHVLGNNSTTGIFGFQAFAIPHAF